MFEIVFSIFIAFIICYVLLLVEIPVLKRAKAKQTILSYVEEHKSKEGTPTMGGIAFLIAITVTFFIMAREKYQFAFFAVLIMLAYGFVGFLDDFIKIKFKRNLGLKAYQKIIFQFIIAVMAGFFVYFKQGSALQIPFTERFIDIGIWIVPLIVVIFLACTNSVNLTDGLDGLASGVSIMYMFPILLLIIFKAKYLLDTGRPLYVEYDNMAILSAIVLGSLLAFMLANAYPAKIFMGDTGSLGLGGIVAIIPILSEFSLFIPIVGIMFVVSSLSVIIQVLYFKKTKKRVFLMAPFHHHLQHKGIHENHIVWIYAMITFFVGMLTVMLTVFV